jgi:hypothetical protein
MGPSFSEEFLVFNDEKLSSVWVVNYAYTGGDRTTCVPVFFLIVSTERFLNTRTFGDKSSL